MQFRKGKLTRRELRAKSENKKSVLWRNNGTWTVMNQQKALENNYACSSDSHLPEPCSRFGAIIGSWTANGLTNRIQAHHPENVRIQSKPPVLKRCLWKSCTYGFQWGNMGDFLKPRLRTPESRRLRLLLARQRGPHQHPEHGQGEAQKADF